MRTHRTKLLALGGMAALVVLTTLLAFAAGSRAASGSICTVNSGTPPSAPASCIQEFVGPDSISIGGDAVSVTKFHNESGISGATATHVLLTLTLPAGVTTDGTAKAFVAAPGTTTYTAISPNPCTTTSASVSCPVGNIKGDGRAKVVVQVQGGTAGQYSLNVEATYGEGGGGTSNPPNDDQINSARLNVGVAGVAGDCINLGPGQTGGVTGGANGQQTQVITGPAGDGTLPCTFTEAGASQFVGGPGVAPNISFVEFPGLSGNGYATVYIIFNPIPTGFNLNKSPIFEDTSGNGTFSTYITVPACDKKGNIVGPTGNPIVGQTDPSPVNDSCVFARTSLGKGTGEVGMHVLANPFDQTYKG